MENKLKNIERFHRKKHKIAKAILKTLDDDEIIHGQRALNIHLRKYPYLQKKTIDYDVFVKKGKAMKEAREAERKLDKLMGFDAFKSQRSKIHASTVKLKALTGTTYADFTVPDVKVPHKVINKRRYRTLESFKKHIKSTLKSGRAEFRRAKDEDMLNRIRILERLKKQKRRAVKKPMKKSQWVPPANLKW